MSYLARTESPKAKYILDYFRDKTEVIDSGDWDCLEQNFLDKLDATNKTAWALTKNGLSFIAAQNLHQ